MVKRFNFWPAEKPRKKLAWVEKHKSLPFIAEKG